MSGEEITTLSRHDAAYSALFHKAMGTCSEGALGAYTDEVTFSPSTRARRYRCQYRLIPILYSQKLNNLDDNSML